MPAINVARTDTFEQQRQKINQIGNQIFSVTQGGSDLATGNLKLGDGTRTAPSLSFTSDSTLGIFKPDISTIGYVADSKILADFNVETFYSYKDVVLQKRVVTDSGSTIQTRGSNYDAGLYSDIALLGGTGDLATIDLTVLEFTGTLVNAGRNYIPGSYSSVRLTFGNGSDSFVNFTVDAVDGISTDAGSGYIPGFYTSIALTGGSGSGAKADVTITGTTNISGSITNPGSGYTDGSYTNVELLNQPLQTFVVTAVSNPGTPPPDNIYNIDGNNQPVLNLIKGNTYAFDVSDSSMATHPLYFDALSGFLNISDYVTISKGIAGTPGATIYFVIKASAPTETIKYDCSSHQGMGSNINIITGSAGQYGTGLRADIEVVGGVVSTVQITSTGSDYSTSQTVFAYNGNIGGTGSGFEYTISNIVYDGVVSTFVVTNSGQDYLNGDVLSFSNSSVGGFGSGFQFEVTTSPGIVRNLSFVSRGSGNQVGDQLSFPQEVSGLTTTLDSLSNTITVSSVAGIDAGMSVIQTSGTGTLGDGITVSTVDSINSSIILSSAPQANGTAVLTFVPVYGTPTVAAVFEVDVLGPVTEYSINNSGNGYSDQDVLTVNAFNLTQPILYDVVVNEVQEITFTGNVPSSDFSTGDSIKVRDGEITSVFVSASTAIQAEEGNTYSNISPTGGTGSGAIVTVDRVLGGSIGNVTIVDGGTDYTNGDTLTIPGNLVGGSSPTDDVELSVSGTTTNTGVEIYKVNESGGLITSIVCQYVGSGFAQSDEIIKIGSSNTAIIDTASSQEYRYFINTGSGFSITPDLSLFAGNTYRFDTSNSSNSSHEFQFSQYRDGVWAPTLIENLSTVFALTSKNITVSSTTGVQPGMQVTVSSGVGLLPTGTFVESVIDSTTIELTEFPIAPGATDINITGVPYLDGVTRSQNYVDITVTSSTPSLYYYCSNHENMGGSDNDEALITIDPNNPKVFGSGFELLVSSTTNSNIIRNNILTGEITAVSFIGTSATIDDVTVNGDITASTSTINTLDVNSITSSALSITAPVSLTGNFNIGSVITINGSNGNITTSGILKTTNSLNVGNVLNISGSVISTSGPNDITFTPSSGRAVKVNSVTSFDLPVGTTLERPSNPSNGSIRFNTTNGQYEGYNASTTSWSSLGGVRDIDGNTYILAELNPGANDNTLWFYNDNINTLKLTPSFLDFRSVKKISSGRLGIPAFTLWTANTPVSIGQYVKYKNNLYEVTGAGTTASVGSEPLHTTGVANNGTSQLTWYSLAVSPLTFEEIEELRVGPNKDCPLIVSSEIKVFNNTISTLVEDLVLAPNAGKKVSIDAPTSLVIPVGNTNQRGSASQGSIRFNTSISQFEGYSGTNWSSLGGVRDVDGNTYIIPETAPAANENILYFYNDNINTLQVTTTELDFTNLDTITTSGGNSLALNTEIVTLDNSATTIDNTDASSSFISTTKQYLDLGLSSGLNVDPVLRLDDQGDVYLNTGFGTGTFAGVKIFDGDLKDFELADYAVKTSVLSLLKGTSNSGAVVLYDTNVSKGCKVTVVSKSSTGKKSMAEYSVIDNGTDVFFNEIGSLNTSNDGFIAVFDITPSNETRITLTLSDDHATNDTVEITVLTQVVK